ncbi:unnamed protein product [Amoebophrya sp. A120]|nr:unnamed protein product [Amoebophrya sp. A120]|eukprot:GSA120T00008271001.1
MANHTSMASLLSTTSTHSWRSCASAILLLSVFSDPATIFGNAMFAKNRNNLRPRQETTPTFASPGTAVLSALSSSRSSADDLQSGRGGRGIRLTPHPVLPVNHVADQPGEFLRQLVRLSRAHHQGNPLPEINTRRDAMAFTALNEGIRLKPYQDHLGYWTVGVGHKLGGPEELDAKTKLPKRGTSAYSEAEIEALFFRDYEEHARTAAKNVPIFAYLNEAGQAALVDLYFNMGAGTMAKFRQFHAALREVLELNDEKGDRAVEIATNALLYRDAFYPEKGPSGYAAQHQQQEKNGQLSRPKKVAKMLRDSLEKFRETNKKSVRG